MFSVSRLSRQIILYNNFSKLSRHLQYNGHKHHQKHTLLINVTRQMSEDLSAKLSALELKMLDIEKSNASISGSESVDKAIHSYQEQILHKLLEIRNQMILEGRDFDQVVRDRDAALAENKKLKEVVEKQNYRISHLIKALNEEESKH